MFLARAVRINNIKYQKMKNKLDSLLKKNLINLFQTIIRGLNSTKAQRNPYTYTEFSTQTKNQTSPGINRRHIMGILDNYYKEYHKGYNDASKTNHEQEFKLYFQIKHFNINYLVIAQNLLLKQQPALRLYKLYSKKITQVTLY